MTLFTYKVVLSIPKYILILKILEERVSRRKESQFDLCTLKLSTTLEGLILESLTHSDRSPTSHTSAYNSKVRNHSSDRVFLITFQTTKSRCTFSYLVFSLNSYDTVPLPLESVPLIFCLYKSLTSVLTPVFYPCEVSCLLI